jgi:aspartyl/asparaginyl-tRNA synthetase
MQIEDAERPLPSEGLGNEDEKAAADEGRPLVGLNTRLNNRTLDLRAKINHCIFIIKSGVCELFQEFLRGKGFVMIQTPKLQGAASEGGSNVFEVKYFDRSAPFAKPSVVQADACSIPLPPRYGNWTSFPS